MHMHGLFQCVIALSFVVPAAFTQSTSFSQILEEVLCHSECTAADNATAHHLNAYHLCISVYNSEYSYRRCNGTVYPGSHYPYCALKQEVMFCTEAFNSEIPAACLNTTVCLEDCKDALQAKYGCCLSINISSYPFIAPRELVRLSQVCAMENVDRCESAVPPLSDSITPNTQCPTGGFTSLQPFIHEGICEINVQYTLDYVSQVVGNTCFNNYLLFYWLCERNVNNTYCDQVRHPNTQRLSDDVRENCNVSRECSLECRESLLRINVALGCCANALTFDERHYSCERGMNIWSHCGVPPPDPCTNSLILNSHGSFVDIKLIVIFAAIILVGSVLM